MLRITVITEAHRTVLKAEGKLSGPWVAELDHCWQIARDGFPGDTILLDLQHVAFVDSAGKELIRRMCNNGVEPVVTGPLVTSIVNEIRADSRRSRLQEVEEVR